MYFSDPISIRVQQSPGEESVEKAIHFVDPVLVRLHPNPVSSLKPQCHRSGVTALLSPYFQAGLTEGHPVLGVPVDLDVQHWVSSLSTVCEEFGRENIHTGVRSCEDSQRRVVVATVIEDDKIELEGSGGWCGCFTGAELSQKGRVSPFHVCRKQSL